MQHSKPPPNAGKIGRDQRTSLWIATLLSLVLHALLGGGLATATLGILPSPTADPPADLPNIFKPKVAADFPLQVPRSPDGEAAHEKPLDLRLPSARAASATPTPAETRTVSPHRGREPEEKARTTPAVPERSATREESRPDATKMIDRADLKPGSDTRATADTLQTKAETSAAAAPARPADTARQPQRTADARATPSSMQQPREVPLVPDAKPRTVAPPAPSAATREATPSPRPRSIARRSETTPTMQSQSLRAESLDPAAAQIGRAHV